MSRFLNIIFSVLLISGMFAVGQAGSLAADEGTMSVYAPDSQSFDAIEYWDEERTSNAVPMQWAEEPFTGENFTDEAAADLGARRPYRWSQCLRPEGCIDQDP